MTFILIIIGILIMLVINLQCNIIFYFYQGYNWTASIKNAFLLKNTKNFKDIMLNDSKFFEHICKILSIIRGFI